MATMHTWDLWYPDAASQGLSFARAHIDPTATLLVHALPASIRVEVRDERGTPIATGDGLARTLDSPMARLTVNTGAVTREETWPTDADLGSIVILPGGEAGKLRAWWHAPDHSQWRWSVEFYNHR